ncbi:unnamed protein product [Lampetra fluviatilis]
MHRSESAEAQHRTRCRAWSDFRRRRTPLSIRRISTTPHGRRGKAGGASGSVGDLVTLRLTFKTPPYARTPPLPCERPDGRRAPIGCPGEVRTPGSRRAPKACRALGHERHHCATRRKTSSPWWQQWRLQSASAGRVSAQPCVAADRHEQLTLEQSPDAAFHVHTFSHRLRLDPNQEPDGRRRIASAGVFP